MVHVPWLVHGLVELEKLLTKRTHFAPLDHSVIVEYKKKFANNELYDDVEKINEQDEKRKDKEVIHILIYNLLKMM